MDKSKKLKQKINLNNENNNNQQNKMFNNEFQNEKEVINEIIIELKISDKENEINILCDKNELIEDNKRNEFYYKRNNINPPKEFYFFNKDNTKLYLNDNEIEFNYKIKI